MLKYFLAAIIVFQGISCSIERGKSKYNAEKIKNLIHMDSEIASKIETMNIIKNKAIAKRRVINLKLAQLNKDLKIAKSKQAEYQKR